MGPLNGNRQPRTGSAAAANGPRAIRSVVPTVSLNPLFPEQCRGLAAALLLQRHFVTRRPRVLCQGEGGGLGPLPSGGLLGHQGHCHGVALDGQLRPDGLLCGASS